ncbi:guanylate kinase [Vallitalea guaymasensis]|uniref:Guanylate kinase n=1 Tax=Vallitalea guaymasensis TaxID=1185412 RepID=A0A8J8M746_9FIRM|nr:guanylate kinase [Vallitalea guaymasensis]QUH27438.1 guanylate kinase [Vallitalea guaymasensis]
MNKKGILIIISGFSGAGKGSVVKELLSKGDYILSISSTTRAPREYEEHGREYFFDTRDDFESMIDNNELIEWASYCDNYYGTPRKFVENNLEQGKNVILEIEMQGALDVKAQYDDAVLIFITAPSVAELKARLEKRGTESSDIINKRLKRSYEEAEVINKYDYIVVNDDLQKCANDINTIINAEHKRANRSGELKDRLKDEFAELLKGEI